jgi:ABC-2 type transport system ATP-binding protein
MCVGRQMITLVPMNVIEVAHLQKRYGSRVAVDDVSFTVAEGEIFGIIGPNGAGKTTTVECLTGLRHADAGSIRVLGLDPRRDDDALHRLVGVQLQDAALPERLRVTEALELFASFYPAPADIDELTVSLGLDDVRSTAFKKLSGGQRQRLSIALALVGRPRIAVLDELTTGLDPTARRETWLLIDAIRARGVSIVLVTHFMEEAERLCDRVAVIDAGRVVATGSPTALIYAAAGGQRIRFYPSAPIDEEAIRRLPEVTSLAREGQQWVVTGTADVVGPVLSVLALNGVVAELLRVQQPTLEEAFIALTGKTPRTDRTTSEEINA